MAKVPAKVAPKQKPADPLKQFLDFTAELLYDPEVDIDKLPRVEAMIRAEAERFGYPIDPDQYLEAFKQVRHNRNEAWRWITSGSPSELGRRMEAVRHQNVGTYNMLVPWFNRHIERLRREAHAAMVSAAPGAAPARSNPTYPGLGPRSTLAKGWDTFNGILSPFSTIYALTMKPLTPAQRREFEQIRKRYPKESWLSPQKWWDWYQIVSFAPATGQWSPNAWERVKQAWAMGPAAMAATGGSGIAMRAGLTAADIVGSAPIGWFTKPITYAAKALRVGRGVRAVGRAVHAAGAARAVARGARAAGTVAAAALPRPVKKVAYNISARVLKSQKRESRPRD